METPLFKSLTEWRAKSDELAIRFIVNDEVKNNRPTSDDSQLNDLIIEAFYYLKNGIGTTKKYATDGSIEETPNFNVEFTTAWRDRIKAGVQEYRTIIKKEISKKAFDTLTSNILYNDLTRMGHSLYMTGGFYLYPVENNLKSSTKHLLCWIRMMSYNRPNSILCDIAKNSGGQGKSTVHNALIDACSELSISASKGQYLPNGQTCPVYADSLIVNIEDTNWYGCRYEDLNNLADKSLFTVKGKYVKEYTTSSIANIVVSANHRPADSNQRRYAIREVWSALGNVTDFLDSDELPYDNDYDKFYADIVKAWKYLIVTVKSMSDKAFVGLIDKLKSSEIRSTSVLDNVYNTLFADRGTIHSDFSRCTIARVANTYQGWSHCTEAIKSQVISNIKSYIRANSDKDCFKNVGTQRGERAEYNFNKIFDYYIDSVDTDNNDFDISLKKSYEFFHNEFLFPTTRQEDKGKKKYYIENYADKMYSCSVVVEDYVNNGVSSFVTLNPIKDVNNIKKDEEHNSPLRTIDSGNLMAINYLFECDDDSIDEQKAKAEELFNLGVVSRVVYSGNKSIHCVITTNVDLTEIQNTKEIYKKVWQYLADKYFGVLSCDSKVAEYSRWTRRPNYYRTLKDGTKKKQELLFENINNVVDVREVVARIQSEIREEKIKKSTAVTWVRNSNLTYSGANDYHNLPSVKRAMVSQDGDHEDSVFRALYAMQANGYSTADMNLFLYSDAPQMQMDKYYKFKHQFGL